MAFEPAERNRIDLEEGLRSGEFDLAETVDRYWSAMRMKPKVVFRTKSIEAVRSLVA